MLTLTLGPWAITTLETGFLRLDGGAMFGSVPKPIWSRSYPADERNRITLAMRCLLLEGEGRRILVDVGVELTVRVTHDAVQSLALALGTSVFLSIKAMAVRVY